MFPLFQTTGKTTIIEHRTPSEKFKPSLSIDGDQWCALYGKDLQNGVSGFGKSPQEAMNDFDKNFNAKLAPRPNVAFIDVPRSPLISPMSINIYADSQIANTIAAKKAAMNHVERNSPKESKVAIKIESKELSERIIGCQDYTCEWNSDYACFHEFPIFAFRGILGLNCISKVE